MNQSLIKNSVKETRTITIKEEISGRELASAVREDGVTLFEGSWYFDPERVDMTHLHVTDRIYVCPYKGRCYWIDLEAPEQQAESIAWIYFELKPGYEFLQDQIGFYAGHREGTIESS